LSDRRDRLASIEAQIKRFKAQINGITAELDLLGRDEPCAPTLPTATTIESAHVIRRLIRSRRLRDQFLGDGLFGDPVWDILLDLYAADLEGAVVSVSSLCIAAAVPPTTALRHIQILIKRGMVERRADPFDRRRWYITLAAPVRDKMTRFFAAAGMPI